MMIDVREATLKAHGYSFKELGDCVWRNPQGKIFKNGQVKGGRARPIALDTLTNDGYDKVAIIDKKNRIAYLT